MQLQSVENKPLILMDNVEHFFSLLYSSKMRTYPKQKIARAGRSSTGFDKERQWVFLGNAEKMKSVATLSSLFGVLADPEHDSTYFTNNGFYFWNKRSTENLRWLNGFAFDIDLPFDSITGKSKESTIDIIDRLKTAGLPEPTAMVSTPSGGYHVHYIFNEPIRATPKCIKLYTAIMKHMANDIDSDIAAVAANRIFRTPTAKTLVYFNEHNTYDFEVFKNWRDINHPYNPYSKEYTLVAGDIMNTPAIEHLLYSVAEEGRREQICFNLCLAMKFSGWAEERAEKAIRDWHNIYCSTQTTRSGKGSFLLKEALYKIKYVYSKPSCVGPSSDIIRELSGLKFNYPAFIYEGKKERSDRERSHYSEWQEDLLVLLRTEKVIEGSQAEIAQRIQCPLSSFKLILGFLINDNKIAVTSRRGRGGKTTIEYIEKKPVASVMKPKQVETTTLYIVDFVNKQVIVQKDIHNATQCPVRFSGIPPDF